MAGSSMATSRSKQNDPQSYFGSGTFDGDLDFDPAAGGSIALDTDGAEGASADALLPESVAPPEDDDLDLFEASAANAQSPATRARVSAPRRKWPTGSPPDVADLKVDAVNVRLAGDYGPAPGSPLLAPVYALRVAQRIRALKAKIAVAQKKRAEAEAARDDLLVSLAQDLRGRILTTEDGDAIFQPVVALEQVALERRAGLAGASAEHGTRVGALEAEMESQRREASAAATRLAERATTVEEARRVHQRSEAKAKRIYIEIRAIVTAAESSGGALTPEQTARTASLDRELAAARAEAESHARAVTAAETAVAAAQAEERTAARRMRETEKKRRELDREFEKQAGTRTAGVSEAEQERRLALVEVGRKVLAARGRLVEVPDASLDALLAADGAVTERATELETLVQALDAYDPGVVRKGAALVLGVVLVVVGGLWALTGGDGAPAAPAGSSVAPSASGR